MEVIPTDGRVVELRSYYEHDDWFLYMEFEKGELGRLAGGEVVSGSYFSARPAEPTRDVPVLVSSVVAKHLSFPGTSTITGSMESDLHQMAAVLGRYHFITGAETLTGLLDAELEYAIGLCRAYFDLLQKLIRRLGSTVHVLPEGSKRSFKDLPDRFAGVALDGDQVRDPEAITEKWGLSRSWRSSTRAKGSGFECCGRQETGSSITGRPFRRSSYLTRGRRSA